MIDTTQATGQLVPSELVWLNAAAFAGKKSFNDWVYTPLGSEASVSLKDLARQVVAAALLGAEQAGAIRIETRPKKTLFGLRTVTALYATPSDGSPQAPPDTLESRLVTIARDLQAQKDKHEVDKIVHNLLTEDVGNPWGAVLADVGDGMSRRGLLETKEVKRLKIFTSSEYVLPERTAELAAGAASAPVQQLLADTKQNRPEVWKLLTDKIEAGFKSRVEQDSDHDSGSSD